jgi:outer membrane protein assembly factor BamB
VEVDRDQAVSDRFPLPLAWTTQLGDEWVVHAPVRVGDTLLVRVRRELFRVRATDGALLGREEIDPDAGQGIVCQGFGDAAIVDIGDAARGKSVLIAVDADGAVRWRTPLKLQLVANTGALAGDQLLVCGHQAGTGNFLLAIDAGTGVVRERTALPRGGVPSRALRWGGATLIASPAGGPGLYVLDGGKAGVLDDRRVQRLLGAGDAALVAARPDDTGCELALYRPGSPEPLWRAPSPGFACAVDGDRVACLIDEGGPRAALRATVGGRVVWRAAEPFERPPSTAALVGGLVLFGAGTRVWVYRRDEGALLGDSREFGTAAIADARRLYVGGEARLAAADLSAV